MGEAVKNLELACRDRYAVSRGHGPTQRRGHTGTLTTSPQYLWFHASLANRLNGDLSPLLYTIRGIDDQIRYVLRL
jgi:hypothetical protein